MPMTADFRMPNSAIACLVAWATAFAAVVSFHWVSLLPSSTNMVGTLSEGP